MKKMVMFDMDGTIGDTLPMCDEAFKRAVEPYLQRVMTKEEIVKTDKRRSSYYNYYTSKKWGEASGYHLCIDSSAVSIEEPRLARAERLAVLLGSEGNGLSPETIACCDDTVRIPMAHGVDSLNVAAAGAVVFWQLRPR